MYSTLERHSKNYVLSDSSLRLNKIDASKLFSLCNFLKGNATIIQISLRDLNYQIADEEAKQIAEMLKTNCALTKVEVSGCKIGVEGIKAIAEALKVNRTVTRLDLYGNQIGDEGAKSIAEALKVNRTIIKLHLYNNKIEFKGAKAIAEALKVNCTITEFNLACNEIGDKGAKAIAEALKVNCTVAEFDLSWNGIGHEGLKAIMEALKLNCTVTRLYFCENGIGIKARIAITEEPKINNFIITLELKQVTMNVQCKTIALGLFQKVPIYVLLDILECITVLDLERKTNSHKFYNNPLFSKLLEKKVSKKRLVGIIDKVNRQLLTKLIEN